MKVFAWLQSRIQAYKSKRVSGATVRYMFPALLGSVILLGASTLTGTSESYVFLTPDTRTVEVGELIAVEIGVFAHTPINAVDIKVEFPENEIEVFSVDRGRSVLTIWTEDPVVENESVRLVGGTFKRGFIGEHEIATIKFRALQTGSYTLFADEITFVAGDGTGTEVEASDSSTAEITLFNFDETTTESEIQVAIAAGITTDLNGDGVVTLQDISAFMGAWNNKSQVFDFNNDGRMSFKDFSIILSDFFTRS